jgi:hypothetical protein
MVHCAICVLAPKKLEDQPNCGKSGIGTLLADSGLRPQQHIDAYTH